jgi:hypothetical protein
VGAVEQRATGWLCGSREERSALSASCLEYAYYDEYEQEGECRRLSLRRSQWIRPWWGVHAGASGAWIGERMDARSATRTAGRLGGFVHEGSRCGRVSHASW